jgi:hypothetical protein
MAEYLFMSVDGKRDFLVFNGGEMLNDEPITNADIEFGIVKNIDKLKSEAWSCDCRWFFIIESNSIVLVNVFEEMIVRCKKKSKRFFEMYLDANRQ